MIVAGAPFLPQHKGLITNTKDLIANTKDLITYTTI